ncbi:MAG TPA: VanZ family protein, partial [Patescibacteria group bacterium]|nr:VanZ family protein [Patescibacteria group bacterium]
MNSKISNLFKYYFPTFAWMLLIFYFSSIPDLKMDSGSVTAEVIVRKIAHLAEFSMLLWLVWRIFYHSWNLINRDALVIALIITLLYAISDEFHQTFVPGRSGQFIDVVFDFLSALFATQLVSIKTSGNLKKYNIFIIAIISLGLSGLTIRMIENGNSLAKNTVIFSSPADNSGDPKMQNNNIGTTQNQNINEEDKKNNNISIPQRVLIKVPFSPQAPFAQWDQFHEE